MPAYFTSIAKKVEELLLTRLSNAPIAQDDDLVHPQSAPGGQRVGGLFRVFSTPIRLHRVVLDGLGPIFLPRGAARKITCHRTTRSPLRLLHHPHGFG